MKSKYHHKRDLSDVYVLLKVLIKTVLVRQISS